MRTKALVLMAVVASASAFSWAPPPSTPPLRRTRSVLVAAEAAEGGGCNAKQIEVCVSTYGKICRRKGGMKTLALFQELAEGESLGERHATRFGCFLERTPTNPTPPHPTPPHPTPPHPTPPNPTQPHPTVGTGVEIIEQQECMDECPMGPNIRLDEVRGDTPHPTSATRNRNAGAAAPAPPPPARGGCHECSMAAWL